jgi:RNA polymerase sigma-70 factor (ECF subfamily)
VTAQPERSPSTGSTRWTIIRDAALGDRAARTEFARRYEPVIRAYVEARWRGCALASHADDAVQDVFLECLRPDGALVRVDPAASGGFRAYLFGVTRNVARQIERTRRTERDRQGSSPPDVDDVEGRERSASEIFERAWAESLMGEAAAVHRERAAAGGSEALRRVDLLRLRFEEGLPVREIARRWDAEASVVHHEYAKAREEFRTALADVVRDHEGGTDAEVRAECARLLSLLG